MHKFIPNVPLAFTVVTCEEDWQGGVDHCERTVHWVSELFAEAFLGMHSMRGENGWPALLPKLLVEKGGIDKKLL